MSVNASPPADGRPLREIVRERIREAIFTGLYPPGARMVERDLAAEYGVSRLPVREALQMLRQEGLLQERASRGLVVSRTTVEQMRDLFDVRDALEVLACRLAAARASKDDLARLADLLAEGRRALADGALERAHRANSAFHDEITAIAGNEFLRVALEPLQGRMHWVFRQVSSLPEVLEEHQRLYEAIASGHPDRAAAQSAAHVSKYRDQVLVPRDEPDDQDERDDRPTTIRRPGR